MRRSLEVNTEFRSNSNHWLLATKFLPHYNLKNGWREYHKAVIFFFTESRKQVNLFLNKKKFCSLQNKKKIICFNDFILFFNFLSLDISNVCCFSIFFLLINLMSEKNFKAETKRNNSAIIGFSRRDGQLYFIFLSPQWKLIF